MGRMLLGVFLLFSATLWLSLSNIDRPLDLRHDWLTAHTTINLEYMRQCGVFRNDAASVLFLPSPELSCGAIRNLPEPGKRIYLSYPTVWLIALYPIYEVAHVLAPDHTPNYVLLRRIELLLVRLSFIFLMIRWVMHSLQLLFPAIRGKDRIWMALTGAAIVDFSPAFLQFTQNILFTDMVVLPLIFAAVELLHRFIHRGAQLWGGLFLSLLLGLASGTDWYGAIFSGFSLALLLLFRRRMRLSAALFAIIAAGPTLAAIHYISQILLFDPGLHQIISTASQRTAVGGGWTENLSKAISYLPDYTPFARNQWTGIVLSSSGLLAFGALVRRAIRSKRMDIWIHTAPILCAIIHLALFSQHAAKHEFYGLKFTPLLSLALASIPAILANCRAIRPGRMARWVTGIMGFAVILGLPQWKEHYWNLIGPRAPVIDHLSMESMGRTFKERKVFLVTIAQKRVDGYVPMNAEGWAPPMSLALAQREVYTLDRLLRYRRAIRSSAWDEYPVILITLNDQALEACPLKWETSDWLFYEGPAAICRTSMSPDQYFRWLDERGLTPNLLDPSGK